MAEYYAVLKKAVSGMEGGAGDARRAVYDKARNALIGQLKAIDPPLSTSEISRQRLELEEAIRRVEREAAAEAQSVRGRAAESVREAVADTGPSPQDVFRRAIQEAESRSSTFIERAPMPARADNGYADSRSMRDRTDRAPPPPMPDPYQDQEPRGRRPQPQLAPDYDYDWQSRGSAPEPVAAEPYVDRRDRQPPPRQGSSRKERGRGYREDEQREPIGRGSVRKSRLPGILLTILFLAVIVGAGAFGWSQWDRIKGFVADQDRAATAQKEPDSAPPDQVATAESSKETDRLGGSPDEAAPGAAVRQVSPPSEPQTASLPQEAPPAADQQGGALVAQKATLYEEPVGGEGAGGVTAIAAQATWQVVNGTDGPEIVANINVPDRAMKAKITIRKNTDAALPASHLVEAVITTGPAFPGKGIRSVPRLVMKAAEDARGQALVGASAKVADGLFWIALSAADADVTNNLKSLRENPWVDIPMIYGTGQRAILTFEKGNPGQQAFQTAMASWGG
jgi:hypothetical protein